MDRRTLRSAVVAACAILAVALAAATLPSAVDSGAGGGAGGSSDGGGLGSPPAGDAPSIALPDVPYVEEILAAVIVVALLATLVYLLLYWREVVWLVVGVAIAVAVFVFLLQALATLFGGVGGSLLGGGDGGGLAGEGSAGVPTLPSVLLFLLVLVAIGGVLAALTGGSDGDDNQAKDADDEAADPAAVGRAAGEAADRIEDATGTPPANEVYRAWLEMTDLLDVSDPETTTPGEFEAAAVDVGLARDDVRELRRLFEDVRYGGSEPSDADERRAVEVFRRIEAAYAGGDS